MLLSHLINENSVGFFFFCTVQIEHITRRKVPSSSVNNSWTREEMAEDIWVFSLRFHDFEQQYSDSQRRDLRSHIEEGGKNK